MIIKLTVAFILALNLVPTLSAQYQSGALFYTKSGDLYMSDLNGANPTPIVTGMNVFWPKARNGFVYFVSYQNFKLYKVNPSVTPRTPQEITSVNIQGWGVLEFDISPDGSQAVLTYTNNPNPSYYGSTANFVMYRQSLDSAASRVPIVNSPGVHNAYPVWGTDGYIYFGQGTFGNAYSQRTLRVQPSGSSLAQLTQPFSQFIYPLSGADKVAFINGLSYQLYTMSPNGSNQQPLPGNHTGLTAAPSFDAANNQIYYVKNGTVYRVALAGGSPSTIVSGVDASRGIALGLAGGTSCSVQYISPTSKGASSVGLFAEPVRIITSTSNSPWNVASSPSWARLTPSSGMGSQTVNLVVDPNPGSQRSGAINVCDKTLTVDQAGSMSGRTVVLLFSGWSNSPNQNYPQDIPPTNAKTTYGLGDFGGGIQTLAWNIASSPHLPGVIARAFTHVDSKDFDLLVADYYAKPKTTDLHAEAEKWLKDTVQLTANDRLFIIGHSYGGNRAYHFADKYYHKASGLVLIDPIGYEKCSISGDALPILNSVVSFFRYPIVGLLQTRHAITSATADCYQDAVVRHNPTVSGTPTFVYRQVIDRFVRGFKVAGSIDEVLPATHQDIDDMQNVHQSVLRMLNPIAGEAKVRLGVSFDRRTLTWTPLHNNPYTFGVQFRIANTGRLLASDVDADGTLQLMDGSGRRIGSASCLIGNPPLQSLPYDPYRVLVIEWLEYMQYTPSALQMSCISSVPVEIGRVAAGILDLTLTARNTTETFRASIFLKVE